ncbi:hypothetical protein EZV62_022203 [Acer yangbiense]|uniref:Reverse transcriptase Ty1/copia-type domain-containing protein n=1 Tax=Acer yangbiense TaxID=1000413 RepID=A0A5C7H7W0_9ROSI|nr:hypothetical protein EZV62_022203 [Acer yangbiense]
MGHSQGEQSQYPNRFSHSQPHVPRPPTANTYSESKHAAMSSAPFGNDSSFDLSSLVAAEVSRILGISSTPSTSLVSSSADELDDDVSSNTSDFNSRPPIIRQYSHPVPTTPRYPTRIRQAPNRYNPPSNFYSTSYVTFLTNIHSLVEPKSYKDAVLDPNWRLAVEEELTALQKTDTWELISLPVGIEVAYSPQSYILSQSKYVVDVIARAGLSDSRPVDTPIGLNHKLCPDDGELLTDST